MKTGKCDHGGDYDSPEDEEQDDQENPKWFGVIQEDGESSCDLIDNEEDEDTNDLQKKSNK